MLRSAQRLDDALATNAQLAAQARADAAEAAAARALLDEAHHAFVEGDAAAREERAAADRLAADERRQLLAVVERLERERADQAAALQRLEGGVRGRESALSTDREQLQVGGSRPPPMPPLDNTIVDHFIPQLLTQRDKATYESQRERDTALFARETAAMRGAVEAAQRDAAAQREAAAAAAAALHAAQEAAAAARRAAEDATARAAAADAARGAVEARLEHLSTTELALRLTHVTEQHTAAHGAAAALQSQLDEATQRLARAEALAAALQAQAAADVHTLAETRLRADKVRPPVLYALRSRRAALSALHPNPSCALPCTVQIGRAHV